MQAADLEKDCNSFTVCLFVLGVWGITLLSFFSGTGLLSLSLFLSILLVIGVQVNVNVQNLYQEQVKSSGR